MLGAKVMQSRSRRNSISFQQQLQPQSRNLVKKTAAMGGDPAKRRRRSTPNRRWIDRALAFKVLTRCHREYNVDMIVQELGSATTGNHLHDASGWCKSNVIWIKRPRSGERGENRKVASPNSAIIGISECVHARRRQINIRLSTSSIKISTDRIEQARISPDR